MQSACKDNKHNTVFIWRMNTQHQQQRPILFIQSDTENRHLPPVCGCIHGWQWAMHARSGALFSLEVKTQTRTKNAAWVMQLVSPQCICSTTPHSCWKRQTERRPGRKHERVARVQSTESYETCSGDGSYWLLGNNCFTSIFLDSLALSKGTEKVK